MRRTRSTVALLLALTTLAVLAAPAAARPPHPGRADAAPGSAASASDVAVLEDCQERFVLVPGDEELVREQVPGSFALSRNAAGNPLLFVGAGRCERYTVNGTTQPTSWAVFAAAVQSPDGVGCFTQWPVVGDVKGDLSSCNFYILFTVYDQPAVVDFWRSGMPDAPVHLVRDLVFEQEALDPVAGGAPFHAQAGPPTPSPFTLDLTVRETPGERPLTARFWSTGSSGTLVARVEIGELGSGQATGSLRPTPGSDMAELLGTDTPTPEPVWTLLAANRWRYGEIRKSVIEG